MKKLGAGHAANKKDPKGKGAFPARGGPNATMVGAGADKGKKLPPWMKKKAK